MLPSVASGTEESVRVIADPVTKVAIEEEFVTRLEVALDKTTVDDTLVLLFCAVVEDEDVSEVSVSLDAEDEASVDDAMLLGSCVVVKTEDVVEVSNSVDVADAVVSAMVITRLVDTESEVDVDVSAVGVDVESDVVADGEETDEVVTSTIDD